MGFLGDSVVKNSLASAGGAGDPGSIPGSGRSPGGGNGSPLQYSCLENPHGQRSLVGYSAWGHKESTDWTHTPYAFNVDPPGTRYLPQQFLLCLEKQASWFWEKHVLSELKADMGPTLPYNLWVVRPNIWISFSLRVFKMKVMVTLPHGYRRVKNNECS